MEATFASINTLFCQHVASYTGSNPTLRGTDATGAWTLPELQDLLDEWLLPGGSPARTTHCATRWLRGGCCRRTRSTPRWSLRPAVCR